MTPRVEEMHAYSAEDARRDSAMAEIHGANLSLLISDVTSQLRQAAATPGVRQLMLEDVFVNIRRWPGKPTTTALLTYLDSLGYEIRLRWPSPGRVAYTVVW